MTVSGVDRIEEASLSYSSLGGWADSERLPQMLNLMQRFWRTRAYGDFWSYMLVAEGAVDAACEPELALHDMVALVPIVTEAGGDRKSTRLNSSHVAISYAVFCLKKKRQQNIHS